MRRRPLCLMCLLMMTLITVLNLLKMPLIPEKPGDRFLQSCSKSGTPVEVAGVVENSSASEEYSWCLLSGTECRSSSEILSCGRIRVSFYGRTEIPPGAYVRLSGIPSLPVRATNPGQFDQAENAKIQKISFYMKNPSVVSVHRRIFSVRGRMMQTRTRLRERIGRLFSSDDAGVLCAMLLGDKELLDDDTRTLWQSGGISHMLAISGLHLTILGMGLFKLLRKCRMPLKAASAVSCAFLFFYCLFTGMAVSTVRALIMFVLAIGAPLAGRTYDTPTALSVAAVMILLDNPYMLTSPAFLMSFSAVLLTCFFQKRSKMTVAAMFYLGMMPLVLSFFSEVPLYSILVNLIAVPFLPAILVLGMAGIALGKKFPWATFPERALLAGMKKLLTLCRHFPKSSLILGKPSIAQIVLYMFLLTLFCLFMYRHRNEKKRMLMLFAVPLLIAVFGWHPGPAMKMIFLDVGQGDGCLLESKHKVDILIDSGSSSTKKVGEMRVIPALKAEGVSSLDYIFLTHMDADHINGIEELLTGIAEGKTAIRVKTVVFPYLENKSTAYRKMWKLAGRAGARRLMVRKGDRFRFDGIRMEVLNPDPGLEQAEMNSKGEMEPDENGQCIVMKVSCGRFDALMTGDVHGDGEESVRKALSKERGHIELLKVAHHGSGLSTPDAFLETVRPEVGVISVGAHNRYGHPKPELLARLKQYHVKIFRTDEVGAVTLQTDGTSYKIQTWLS